MKLLNVVDSFLDLLYVSLLKGSNLLERLCSALSIRVDARITTSELLDAALDGDIAKVKELLGQGLPVDVKDEVNCTCTNYSKSSLERSIH